MHRRFCNATSKFDVRKIEVELNLRLKATSVFKKQRGTRIPLQLPERVQHLLDLLTQFNKNAHVDLDSLTIGNTFMNPVFMLKIRESLKTVLDAGQLNTVIDATKCSW